MSEPATRRPPGSPGRSETLGAAERESLLANALAEFIDLQARDETVDLESFCQRHARLGPELREALEALEEINRAQYPSERPETEDSGGELPEQLSGHRILSEIGAGGMGRVLLAVDERLRRKVAIKTLSRQYCDNIAIRTRFMKEARSLARLSHPNVVHIYNLGLPGEPPHFVMEYLEGVPLTQAARPLPLERKVELMCKIVRAVEYLHQNHVVHRDLKPGNILVGADLEPKLLDFGLALEVEESGSRLTLAGEVMGTPDYFSPEQTRADGSLDVRSDVFSLGTIFYELLTGTVPFRGETFAELSSNICQQDPILPRRLDSSIPGELQNVCMKALEKNPADRYNSAREMADDLERFLAGEPVLAAPLSYGRLMAGKIEQHLRALEAWKQDNVLSDYEFDALRKGYDRLVEREDAWIMEARRLSLPQVSLYLGACVLVAGAALVFLFPHWHLQGTRARAARAVLLVAAAAVPTGYLGVRYWKQGRLRIAVAYLLAFCLLVPITFLLAMGPLRLFTGFTQGRSDLEFFLRFRESGEPRAKFIFRWTTNAQMWWAIFLSLPAYLWLRRFTRSSVFSLVFAVMAALLTWVTLLRQGLLDWIFNDPGQVYFHLMPYALAFFLAGIAIERLNYPNDSRYFYPIAVALTLIAFSGVAGYHKPYAEWLERTAPWTRGQIEYLFIINAGLYAILQWVCERFHTAQMRGVAKAFRFVIPGHVLTSLLLLGLEATRRWKEALNDVARRREAHTIEVLLPLVACAFVLGSIPKQMKNYLASGLLFLAIGIIRLQQNWLKYRTAWPVALLVVGVALMLCAVRYSAIRMTLARWLHRKL